MKRAFTQVSTRLVYEWMWRRITQINSFPQQCRCYSHSVPRKGVDSVYTLATPWLTVCDLWGNDATACHMIGHKSWSGAAQPETVVDVFRWEETIVSLSACLKLSLPSYPAVGISLVNLCQGPIHYWCTFTLALALWRETRLCYLYPQITITLYCGISLKCFIAS